MEKRLNSAIATLLSVLLLFVYMQPYYMPGSLAASQISNGSPVINGSITGIPADVKVILFIADITNNQLAVVRMLSSTNNVFSQPLDVNDNDIIVFRINGKDAKTIQYNSSITFVEVPYVPPGPVDVSAEPITVTPKASAPPMVATPAPAKVFVTTGASSSPLPTSVSTSTATTAPILNSPAASAASPTPTEALPVYSIIYAILVGITLLVLLMIFLSKR